MESLAEPPMRKVAAEICVCRIQAHTCKGQGRQMTLSAARPPQQYDVVHPANHQPDSQHEASTHPPGFQEAVFVISHADSDATKQRHVGKQPTSQASKPGEQNQ